MNLEAKNRSESDIKVIKLWNKAKNIYQDVYKFGLVTFKCKKILFQVTQETLKSFQNNVLKLQKQYEKQNRILNQIIECQYKKLSIFDLKNYQNILNSIQSIKFQYLTNLILIGIGIANIQSIQFINAPQIQEIAFSQNYIVNIKPLSKIMFQFLKKIQIYSNPIIFYEVGRISWSRKQSLKFFFICQSFTTDKYFKNDIASLVKIFQARHQYDTFLGNISNYIFKTKLQKYQFDPQDQIKKQIPMSFKVKKVFSRRFKQTLRNKNWKHDIDK